jgi:hypothetical protein
MRDGISISSGADLDSTRTLALLHPTEFFRRRGYVLSRSWLLLGSDMGRCVSKGCAVGRRREIYGDTPPLLPKQGRCLAPTGPDRSEVGWICNREACQAESLQPGQSSRNGSGRDIEVRPPRGEGALHGVFGGRGGRAVAEKETPGSQTLPGTWMLTPHKAEQAEEGNI